MEESTVSLPAEHITWMVNTDDDFECEDEDGELTKQRMVAIMDTSGVIIICDVKTASTVDAVEQITSTLKSGMLHPMYGQPRRPSCVLFRNGPSLSNDALKKLGIRFKEEKAACGCLRDETETNHRTCAKCRRSGDPPLFHMCPHCHTVAYCSKQCQESDFNHPMDVHSHRKWCEKMKGYCQNESKLAEFPFTFASETTKKDFGGPRYTAFLKKHGVFGQGLWQREINHKCPKHMPKFGDLQFDESPYVLTKESNILSSQPTEELPNVLSSWKEYYDWRGLSLDSPIAILLTMPLTLYHILNILPQHYPGKGISGSSELTIHVIGAEKETDYVKVFEELKYLLPNVTIDLLFIGPEISNKVSCKVVEMGNVKVTIKKGVYHHYDTTTKPDVVIGFNAGLGAYMSWGETLVKLKEQNIPAFFTDYCKYSGECARSPMEGLQLGTISPISINPFRSPRRQYCPEHTMPWYSNGFIYSLKYAQ